MVEGVKPPDFWPHPLLFRLQPTSISRSTKWPKTRNKNCIFKTKQKKRGRREWMTMSDLRYTQVKIKGRVVKCFFPPKLWVYDVVKKFNPFYIFIRKFFENVPGDPPTPLTPLCASNFVMKQFWLHDHVIKRQLRSQLGLNENLSF